MSPLSLCLHGTNGCPPSAGVPRPPVHFSTTVSDIRCHPTLKTHQQNVSVPILANINLTKTGSRSSHRPVAEQLCLTGSGSKKP